MSSEDDAGVSFGLPGEVNDWLAREADRRNETRDDVCRRLITAAHAVATADDIEAIDFEDLTAVDAQLDAQREEFMDLLEDVRSRVVQVKRETDGKAPADHTHDEYAAEDDLESIRDDLDDLESTVDDGFDNFEDILEHLLNRSDEIEERSTLLAKAVVDLREHRDAVAERERRRAEADRLKRAANQLGIRTATCDACDGRVDVALLTEPECPHCATAVRDVAEKTSIFGSHTLVTGDPPALEGHVETTAASTSGDVFDAVEEDARTDAATDEDGGTPVPEFDPGRTIR